MAVRLILGCDSACTSVSCKCAERPDIDSAADRGEPALLRARRDAVARRGAARRNPAAGLADPEARPRRGHRRDPDRRPGRQAIAARPTSSATRFGLHAVHVAPSLRGPEDVGRRMIGRLGAEVLRASIRDGAVVGVGDGASISALADALDEPLHATGATVVPLCGGYWFTGPAREPFRRVADAIGGDSPGPPCARASSTTRRRSSRSYAHAGVRRILDLWERLDVAAFGIGGPAWGRSGVRTGGLPPARRRRSGRRAAHRSVRHRWPVRRQRPRDADDRVRCSSAGSVAGPDRRRRRLGQGPADPRGAALGRLDDARLRRRGPSKPSSQLDRGR